MRYPQLKDEKTSAKTALTVSEFEYGINDEAGKWASDDCVLAECVNMNYDGDVIKTRSGISAVSESVVGLVDDDTTVYLPFTVTPTVYYKNSKPYNLSYCCTGDETRATLRFFLVGSSGSITNAGELEFHRLDSTTFSIPVNVMFMVADEMGGSGVLAFIKRSSLRGNSYEVYKANTNMTSWQSAENDLYVPTVLINGRGESYEQAHSLGDFSYPDPEELEEINLINGKFKCFFTSDELSSYFRLPVSNILSYSPICCRLYSSPDSYVQWNIPFIGNSDTQTVSGQQITLYIDRSLGLLRFCTPNSDYPVPIMPNCKLNNIMVTAIADSDENAAPIFSSSGAVMIDNRIYFYGNKDKKNCIYCAKMNNPLYFPYSAKLYIGDGTSPVTALKVQNGKLIAFKPGETYKITTSFKDQSIKKAILPENTLYIRPDTLSAQTIDNSIGCPYPDTIRLCGSRLVWLSGDKNIYALATTTYGNTTNIYRVSQPLGTRLIGGINNAQNIFAVTDSGKYILMADNRAFVMNFRVRGFGYSRTYYSKDDTLKSPAWFEWQLPENVKFYGGEQVGGNAILLRNFNTHYYHMAVISGDKDTAINLEENAYITSSFNVEARLKTKIFDFGYPHRLKRFDSLFICGESEDTATLTLYGDSKSFSVPLYLAENTECIRMCAGIPACREVAAEISCQKPFYLRNFVFKYKLLSDKG